MENECCENYPKSHFFHFITKGTALLLRGFKSKWFPMEIFIGIDQTGASASGGKKAKPLPMCVAVRRGYSQWRFLTMDADRRPLMLDRFHPECLREKFERLKIEPDWGKTAFIVDCVLGMPKLLKSAPTKVKPYLWGFFEKAVGFSKDGKEFGREVAEAFFSEFLPPNGEKYPRRFCEEVSGSNSVFQTKPYQKNIQTGTFRLWKDLGSVGRPWVHIWPFESRQKSTSWPWMFEGYPSLLWRECLQSPVRDPRNLRKLCEKTFPQFEIDTWKFVQKLPDSADSFVLALGGVSLLERKRLWTPSPSFKREINARREGWLLGLKHPKDI